MPLCDLTRASLGTLLPSGDSERVISRVGRVRKAPNVGGRAPTRRNPRVAGRNPRLQPYPSSDLTSPLLTIP